MKNELQLSGSDLPVPSNGFGMIAIEQTRAIAETQAAMMVAMARPRNEMAAYERIIKACERKSLAGTAMYAYPRGGQMVEGPSIRLAEVLARAWGNITYGLRELSRSSGSSEVEAFAWDLESNTRVTRQFVVNHIRDKRGGGKKLSDERDIYELTANQGQRRVRACLLELIPGDIVEEAVAKCNETLLKDSGDIPIEDRVRKMVSKFNELGVTAAMLENYLGHKLSAVVPQQLVKLQKVYKSVYDGVASREDFFDVSVGDGKAADLNAKFNSAKPAKVEVQDEVPPSTDPKVEEKENQPAEIDHKAAEKETAAIDKLKTSLAVDKWRASNAQRIFTAYGNDTADAILNHAATVYEALKADEEQQQQ